MYREPLSVTVTAEGEPGHVIVAPTATPANQPYTGIGEKMEKHSGFKLALLLFLTYPLVRLVRREKRKGTFPTPLTRLLFVQLSPWLEEVRKGNARWPAMTQVYNHQRLHRGPLDTLWSNIRSSQDLRNRFRVVRAMVRHSVETWIGRRDKGESVCVLTIACGSGEAVIRACADYGSKVVVHALDQDKTALNEASNVALKYGMPRFTAHQGNFSGAVRLMRDLKPQVVEMVGLGDYLSDESFVALVQRIRLGLPTGGYFIVSHIHSSRERYILDDLCDWDPNMRYRSREEFLSLLRLAGWADEEMEVETLPWAIHTVVRCCRRD